MPKIHLNKSTPSPDPVPSSPSSSPPVPFWQTTDGETVRLYCGDVREVLKGFPAQSVQCVVTSPPYWNLRDYGTGTWEGGDPKCDHIKREAGSMSAKNTLGPMGHLPSTNAAFVGKKSQYKFTCPKCGAKRTDQQLGSEPSPDCGTLGQAQCGQCFVCNMVRVFREVRRVLRDDGTLWLNLGDTYGASNNRNGIGSDFRGFEEDRGRKPNNPKLRTGRASLPQGNLVGIPWRVALALQADGWILRQDIVWSKPNPMPESVRNRCTKAHEYIFLLTKKAQYFYDQEAIKENTKPGRENTLAYYGNQGIGIGQEPTGNEKKENRKVARVPKRANKRDVWTVEDHRELLDWLVERDLEMLEQWLEEQRNKSDTWRVASEAYPGAHYATFSSKLITPCILAGTSAKGACARCGSPWERVVGKVGGPPNHRYRDGLAGDCKTAHTEGTVAGSALSRLYREFGYPELKTIGWEPTCSCFGRFESERVEVVGVKVAESAMETPTGWATGKGKHAAISHQTAENKGKSEDRRRREAEQNSKKRTETITRYVSDIPIEDHPVRPCIVLDPFIGSGTTVAVSLEYGRYCWGIDLSESYLKENAIPRIEGVLYQRPDTAKLIPRKPVQSVKIGQSCLKKG